MKKKLLSAENLRLIILEFLYRLWEIRPGPNQFFSLQEVWKEIYKKNGHKIDNHLSEGVLDSLQKEGLIEIEVNSEDKFAAVRITETGRIYLEKDTRVKRFFRKTKNHPILYIIIVLLILIISLSKFTNAIDSIITFSKKYLQKQKFQEKNIKEIKLQSEK